MSKRSRGYRDPHAAREAARYERPVASRELILQVLNDIGRPQTRDQLEVLLDVVDEQDREALRRRLKAMLRDGQLAENRRGQYGIVERMALVPGRVQGHRDGFGFVVPDAGGEDLFVSPRQMQAVLDGDRVLVSPEGRNRFGKREARIVEVIERVNTEVVGRYVRSSAGPGIEPANRRITTEVLIEDANGITAREGDHVRAEITHYPDGREPRLLVRLLEVIASPDQPGMEVDVALRSHDIPFVWPVEVEAEAAAIPDQVSEKSIKGRVDLRNLPLVTIDGEDARDFDDAVFVEKRRWRRGWRLIVAIADVSHYVQPGSALDEEAHRRGTSVYFPNRVIPMLPEKLSNGLCSLNPDVDRLCLFCEMQVSANGRITGFHFGEGVMRSRKRLTYTQVGALLEEPGSPAGKAAHEALDSGLRTMLGDYHSLYQALRKRRDERGAIDFETVETRIIYDEQKKISAIEPVRRNVAHMMIEEAMLAANICAARLLEQSGLPALYRNHEPPKTEKLQSLKDFLGPLGVSLAWSEKDGDAKPAVFQKLAEAISKRPDRILIQTVMLRSLTQARYTAENKGHFGLAYAAYTHFTSPIRRYPDLLVHRTIRYLIRSGDVPKHTDNPGKLPKLPQAQALPYDQAAMVQLGEHCSMTERRADDATRDVVQWLKCQYMQQHIGDEFPGVISGVTNFGLFVQLDDLYVDGLVHVAHLDSDYYHHDEKRHMLIGESSGRRFQLGDSIRVQVAAVHVEDRKIDLQLAQEQAPASRKRGGVRQALAEGRIPKKDGATPRKPAGKPTGKSAAGKAAAGQSKKPAGKPASARKATAGKSTEKPGSGKKPARRSRK
ncbi:ribonuclease R [Alcanivorax quisquiliarum]|uniref:Ribonuclease R n=1 Tax=Alcanivorax quisquiliarum TaxID=2933565 RepID=A0ABT0E6M7_9GAMM|nr:ribonuclease R [Alcanivorax quisquiliarum]MCK0537488.1 ribonuclease R [Alcanivorax quisquiliarum]